MDNAKERIVHSDPEIMGGTPVFVGTRVPVTTLLYHVMTDEALSEFLENFPSVNKTQAIAALEIAFDLLVADLGPEA